MWDGARSYTPPPQRQSTATVPSALSVFLLLLAVEAIPGVWQRVQPFERNVLLAGHALAERFGMPVKAAQRFLDVPEKAPFFAREQEGLLALHCVGALIGHVERVGAQVPVVGLRSAKRLVGSAELFQRSTTFVAEAFFEVVQRLLVHFGPRVGRGAVALCRRARTSTAFR